MPGRESLRGFEPTWSIFWPHRNKPKADSSLRTLAAISVAHWVSHFHLFVLPMLFPFLKEQLGVGYIELGFALTVFGVVSGLTQAPIGYLADHIGARKVLLIGLTVGGLALIMLGLHLSYASLIVCAALLGLANSVYHPCDYAILSAHMDEARMGRAFSIHTFAGFLGGAVAPAIMAALVASVGGLGALIVAGAVGPVVALLLIAVGIPDASSADRKADGAAGAEAERHHARHHHADDLLHAARPVQCRHQQFRRRRADERLWRDILGRQHRADRLSRRQCGRRAGRRLSRRPHQAPRPGRRRLLCDQRGHHAGHCDDNLPSAVLTVAMGIAGFLGGVIAPSRDMLVRNAAPPGAAGSAFGIVSTGFNFSGILSPLLFGWIMDQNMPHWVFGASVVFMVLTVLLALVTDRKPAGTGQTAPIDAGLMHS